MTSASFCKVEGTRLVLNGKNHFVYSANYWQAMNLGVRDEANKKGDRKRLLQDLDHLKKSGVNNLRVMAASEGPNSEPFRMTPALMNKPGDYDEDVLDGFDFAMAEISKRGLTAVVCFNNFWHWSGGFSQYVNWITSEPIPYPPSWSPELGDYTAGTSDENWQIFIDYANQFYTNPEVSKTAQKWYRDHISFILNRKNKYTGLYYKEDPTVLAFELCNEPQTPPPEWVEDTAKFIKSIAPNHLVTVGLESKFDQKEFDIAHKCPSIDYCTNHVWVQNRGEYDMLDSSEKNISHGIAWATKVIDNVNEWAVKIGKPLILEEFGFPRDNWHATEKKDYYKWTHPITNKDRYYKAILSRTVELRKQGGAYCGFGFWVYSGCSRPGDNWIGDPHHEAPGWYSVYDTDVTTLAIMNEVAQAGQNA